MPNSVRRVYLDNSATTPVDPRVASAMARTVVENFGNASSVHGFGQQARAAVDRARRTWPARTVHVECDDLSHVERALSAGADAILLDNMTVEEVVECVSRADGYASSTGRRRPLLEVSGNVTLETVGPYAATGVDCISSSSITMSAPVLDIGLDVEVDA
jgi:nicotinate-nucleotide pyrophosphorylase (carboxylating)